MKDSNLREVIISDGAFSRCCKTHVFRRSKAYVIDRKEFVQLTCHGRWDEIFGPMFRRGLERPAETALT